MGDTFVVRLRQPIDTIDPYALDGWSMRVVRQGDGIKVQTVKPASQPANPAFDRVLRRSQHMRIGLRYPGDSNMG